jgi:hypothetical protein
MTDLSWRKANSSILTRLSRSTLRFSALLLCPSNSAILAYSHQNRHTCNHQLNLLSFPLVQSPTHSYLSPTASIRSAGNAVPQQGSSHSLPVDSNWSRTEHRHLHLHSGWKVQVEIVAGLLGVGVAVAAAAAAAAAAVAVDFDYGMTKEDNQVGSSPFRSVALDPI